MVRMSQMLRSTDDFKKDAGAVAGDDDASQRALDRPPAPGGLIPAPEDGPGQGGGAVDLASLARLSSLLLQGAAAGRSPGPLSHSPVALGPLSVPTDTARLAPLEDTGPEVAASGSHPAPLEEIDPLAAAVGCSVATLGALRESRPVDTERFVATVRDLVRATVGTDNYLLRAIHEKIAGDYLAVHSTNVTIISVKIGEAMKFSEDKLLLLGITAFLHDLGMVTVPERTGAFTDEDKELLRQHPAATKRLIKALGPSLAEIAEIAGQEQEREDGSGYPNGLSGRQIHEFAKIIGLADTYEAMTHSRAHREGFLAHRALKEVIDLRTSKFSREGIKALIKVVSIYPLGSLVRLNSGAIGRVMLKSDSHPTRPTIRLLVDAQGKSIREERLLDLEQEPMLYIADAQVADSEIEE